MNANFWCWAVLIWLLEGAYNGIIVVIGSIGFLGGITSSVVVELWSKNDGLYLVLSLRFTSLVVELDALVMVLCKWFGEN